MAASCDPIKYTLVDSTYTAFTDTDFVKKSPSAEELIVHSELSEDMIGNS